MGAAPNPLNISLFCSLSSVAHIVNSCNQNFFVRVRKYFGSGLWIVMGCGLWAAVLEMLFT